MNKDENVYVQRQICSESFDVRRFQTVDLRFIHIEQFRTRLCLDRCIFVCVRCNLIKQKMMRFSRSSYQVMV